MWAKNSKDTKIYDFVGFYVGDVYVVYGCTAYGEKIVLQKHEDHLRAYECQKVLQKETPILDQYVDIVVEPEAGIYGTTINNKQILLTTYATWQEAKKGICIINTAIINGDKIFEFTEE